MQETVDTYLPEPKTTHSILQLDLNINLQWIREVKDEYQNLINNQNFNFQRRNNHSNNNEIQIKINEQWKLRKK